MSYSSTHNYVRLMESGDIKNMTVNVLRYIKENTGTDIYQMRIALNMPHQSLTACLSNLMDEGLVKIIGDRKYEDNSYSILKYVDGTFSQSLEKQSRLQHKYELWIKRGIEEFKDLMPSSLLMQLTISQTKK